MVTKEGNFDGPEDLTHTIAAVQYGVQLATLSEWKSQGTRPMKNPGGTRFDRNRHETQLMDQHFGWLYINNWAPPFKTLLDWMCLATTVVWNEKIPDATSWEDAQMTKLKVGNCVVTINGLKRAIRFNISTLRFFFQHIKNGAKLPEFMVS